MSKIQCKLLYNSVLPHLSQIYTGFSLLENAGIIRLSQEYGNGRCYDDNKPPHLRNAALSHLSVIVNDAIKVVYDTHDSHEIDLLTARHVDYYFKRSYEPTKIPCELHAKILPLGLNYALYTSGFDRMKLERIVNCRKGVISTLKQIAHSYSSIAKAFSSFTPTLETMHSSPEYSRPPQILFAVRAWDPAEIADHPKEKIDEWNNINDMRVKCIELLRKEFGNAFLGGFQHSKYAVDKYRHVLLPDNRLSRQKNYLKLLKNHSICVATTGLHNSIGWKFGEYVAFSKAIVSEKLNYVVPGDFAKDKNYLEFDTPEQCVEQTARLFADAELRCKMMKSNHSYYNSYVRPDRLILRTLNIALS